MSLGLNLRFVTGVLSKPTIPLNFLWFTAWMADNRRVVQPWNKLWGQREKKSLRGGVWLKKLSHKRHRPSDEPRSVIILNWPSYSAVNARPPLHPFPPPLLSRGPFLISIYEGSPSTRNRPNSQLKQLPPQINHAKDVQAAKTIEAFPESQRYKSKSKSSEKGRLV